MKYFAVIPQQQFCGTITSAYSKLYEALLLQQEPEQVAMQYNPNPDYIHTRTIYTDMDKLPVWKTTETRAQFNKEMHLNSNPHWDDCYTSFRIPKRTGGFRTIDAPSEELKKIQRNLAYFFQHDLGALAHEAAHAYVKGRSPKTSLEVHQANHSKWFLKLDIKDFFSILHYRICSSATQ